MAVVLVIGLTTLAGFFVAAAGVAGRLAEWRHPSSPPHRKGQFSLTLIAVQAIAMLLGAMASILIQLP